MTRDEIKETIDNFLLLVEKGRGSQKQNETELKFLLDKLAMAQHFANYKFDEKDYPDAPPTAYEDLRSLATARFPGFSYYNVPKDVTGNIGEGGLIAGDAIDDIAGIAGDLLETKWCWENNSIEDGLWHFRDGFYSHWSRHLRELQLYLLHLERGT